MKTALIAGATGLVGGFLLEELLRDNRYAHVVAVTRNRIGMHHPRLLNMVADFNHLTSAGDEIQADDVFCCLGTTIRKVGSQQAFRKVDYDYTLQLAQLTFQQGAKKFLLVSALGANPSSLIFYNRVKGEVENAVMKIGFYACHIFRPSLLLGPRTEKRPGEDAARWFYQVFGRLIPLRYRGIHARTVARAMVYAAHLSQPGIFIHESAEMQSFST